MCRKERNTTKGYFLAGRSMTWFPVSFFSLHALIIILLFVRLFVLCPNRVSFANRDVIISGEVLKFRPMLTTFLRVLHSPTPTVTGNIRFKVSSNRPVVFTPIACLATEQSLPTSYCMLTS